MDRIEWIEVENRMEQVRTFYKEKTIDNRIIILSLGRKMQAFQNLKLSRCICGSKDIHFSVGHSVMRNDIVTCK